MGASRRACAAVNLESTYQYMDALPRPLDLMTADEAAARLTISHASLYAYVSRGLIRSFASPNDPRQRLYSAADVEALLQQRSRLRRPRVAAATALDWGLPVLETTITQIKDGRLFYRGIDAIELAERASLEDMARLLIKPLDADPFAYPSPRIPQELAGFAEYPAEHAQAFVHGAMRALSWMDLSPDDVAREAGTILRLLAFVATGVAPTADPMHEFLAVAWHAPQAADTVRRALVLSADHELSSSAFAVRVVASTGAELSAAVIAGLAALSGPRHGGATDRVRAFLDESNPCAEQGALSTPERPPGFGHLLYPDGDPRAAALLSRVPLLAGDEAAIRQGQLATGRLPTIDFALVAIERAYRLPKGAAFAMFALGRAVGLIAHAVEQRSTPALIRPRARYVIAEQQETRSKHE